MANTSSLYELIKQKAYEKSRKLKIVCDWDDTLQPINPLIWYKLAKQKGWKVNKEPFEEFFKYYWENSTVEYKNNVP